MAKKKTPSSPSNRGWKLLTRLLAFALVLGVGFLGYTFLELRQALFKVFETNELYQAKNPQSDLVVVEFFDYTCESCRTLHPVLKDAMEQDGRIIYIPRPVAYKDPWKTHLVSSLYAAALQGKMIEMHNGIMEQWPVLTEEKLYKVAEQVGLDTKKFSRDIRGDDARMAIIDNERFFEAWGLGHVPVLLVGGKFMYMPNGTTPDVGELLDKFEAAR